MYKTPLGGHRNVFFKKVFNDLFKVLWVRKACEGIPSNISERSSICVENYVLVCTEDL